MATPRAWTLGAGVLGILVVIGLVLFLSPREPVAPAIRERPARSQAVLPPPPHVAPPPAATPRDEERPGLLTLEGFVVDEADAPVPGAQIRLEAQPPRQASSDLQGYFSVSGLAGRSYEVTARKAEASLGPVRVTVVADAAPVLLRLRRGSRLQVQVRDARDGSPLPGAQVALVDGSLAAQTDAQGSATLAGLGPGRCSVRAAADGFAPARREVYPSAQPGAVDAVTLSLVPGAMLAGTVVDPAGHPVEGATVELERASAALFLTPDSEAARTDPRGAFRFDAVAAGAWRLRASHPAWAPAVTAPFEADGVTPQPRHWLRLAQGGRVQGRVLTRAGAAAPFAEVQAVFDQASSFKAARKLLCDDAGTFELAGLPRVAVALSASDAVGSSRFQVVDLSSAPEVRGVTLRLDQDGVIGGVVVGSDGAPRPEVVVRLADDPSILALPHTPAAELSGPDGSFLLRGVEPGRHVVQAVAPGSPFPRLVSSRTRGSRVEVETGARDVRLVLDEGAVRGRVAFADGSAPAQFTLQLEDDVGDRQTFSSGDGAFRLARVPAGEHGLRVLGPDFDEARVLAAVPSGGEVDVGTVTLPRGRTVRGEVRDAQGPVAGARVVGARSVGDELDLALGSPLPYDRGQETVSDADGAFVLRGLDPQIRVLVADHPLRGTSPYVAAPAAESEAPVVLTLQVAGSISGRLTRGGRPVQGALTATSEGKDGALARAFVTSEADGTYRFDRLPPGRYLLGYGGAYRLDLLTVAFEQDERTLEVVLGPGEQRTLDLEVPARPVLQVQATQAGVPVPGFVYLGPPDLRATGTRELEELEQAKVVRAVSSEWWSALQSELPPHTSVLPAVDPGPHTLCVRHLEATRGPVGCQPLEVPVSPDVQRVTVELPPP